MPIERVYPTSEQLSNTKPVSCPECRSIFKSESNLNLHLAKTHKQPQFMERNSDRIFHCPATCCHYNQSKSFKLLKDLKQHYLKVHLQKDFTCSTCNRSFATARFRDSHSEFCQVAFKCCDCSNEYNSYETLRTHGRRKNHTILDKACYKTNECNKQVKRHKSDSCVVVKYRQILPRPMSSESSSQTDIYKSRQTQTGNEKTAVETQTIGDHRSEELTRSSSETQTTLTDICSSELLFDDATFFNCHTETQTDLFDDALFTYCDDYTNMCTQTCDDLMSNDFCIDSHTQTVIDDMLKSVESQTMVSQSKQQLGSSCKYQANMETQTEAEFQKMLEEINV